MVDILRGINNLISVKGNHDDFFLRFHKSESSNLAHTAQHGKSHYLLREGVLPNTLKFLDSLPENYVDDQNNIALFHGSPDDHLNGYVYSTDSLEYLKDAAFSIILLGHTHYPMCKKVGNTLIVNPGSCGQPRDCNKPSYVILDTATKNIVFKRVLYDIDLMIKDILKNNEKNGYLIEVLKREQGTCAR